MARGFYYLTEHAGIINISIGVRGGGRGLVA